MQQVVGNFLYYECTVDPTILVALNNAVAEQAKNTQATAKEVTQMLKYAIIYSEAITRYYTSWMVLHIHINASFLSYPESKSKAGGYNYINTKSADPNKAPLKQPQLNGPVHV